MHDPQPIPRQSDCETDGLRAIYVYVDKPGDLTVRPMRTGALEGQSPTAISNLPTLTFAAEEVAAEAVTYTPNCVVYMIAFGAGDPEADGHSWNFSRSFDDDWGVCTVREIQQATLYEGIASFKLHRTGLECVFDAKGAAEAGVAALRITFEIDDREWRELVDMAQVVFRNRDYFLCSQTAL